MGGAHHVDEQRRTAQEVALINLHCQLDILAESPICTRCTTKIKCQDSREKVLESWLVFCGEQFFFCAGSSTSR